jgi:hypothetical protein
VMLEGRAAELVLLIEDAVLDSPRMTRPARSVNGGLGLTSMRERAALAGGSLTVESAVGPGHDHRRARGSSSLIGTCPELERPAVLAPEPRRYPQKRSRSRS